MNGITRCASGHRPTTIRRGDTLHLAVRAFCIGTAAAATVSLFVRCEGVLGDPLPAAILTLLAVMMVLVATGSRTGRP